MAIIKSYFPCSPVVALQSCFCFLAIIASRFPYLFVLCLYWQRKTRLFAIACGSIDLVFPRITMFMFCIVGWVLTPFDVQPTLPLCSQIVGKSQVLLLLSYCIVELGSLNSQGTWFVAMIFHVDNKLGAWA